MLILACSSAGIRTGDKSAFPVASQSRWTPFSHVTWVQARGNTVTWLAIHPRARAPLLFPRGSIARQKLRFIDCVVRIGATSNSHGLLYHITEIFRHLWCVRSARPQDREPPGGSEV